MDIKLYFPMHEYRCLMIGMPELVTARFVGVPKEINEIDKTAILKVKSHLEGDVVFKDYKLADLALNLRSKRHDEAMETFAEHMASKKDKPSNIVCPEFEDIKDD